MKKLAILIILTSFGIFVHAQDNAVSIKKFIITYNGDSLVFTEKYEIDLNKKKVYNITPIMNHLDVKGEESRTKVKLKKHEWEEITQLIKNLSSPKHDFQDKIADKKVVYSFEVCSNSNATKERIFYDNNIPSDLKKLFLIIRE